ncbi:MAG TPA: NrfD/PsrC family molybdoenzyme membrane anchor subunit [Candidatus Sulfomarinibacteraceae bacterium]|nr:NrfD/PsrC family molybdoenzyme membrane anchor subunit [Candidatus Sulfomarinibacteraceae bacterium]
MIGHPARLDTDALEAAAFRPIFSPGRWFWPVAALLAIIVLGGVAAFVYQFTEGMWVAGYSDRAFYGIYEANLVAFIGVSYGGAVVSAVLRLVNARWGAPLSRMAEAMAVVALIVGGAFAIVHLGRPERVFLILISGNLSSPIVWDFLAITIYLTATVIFLYLPLIPDMARLRDRLPTASFRGRLSRMLAIRWQGLDEQRQRLRWGIAIVAILVVPLAVSVHSVLAYTFSMTTRPGWHSTIFGPYFVVGALYSGVGLVILVVAAFRRAYRLEAFITPRQILSLAWMMAALGLVYLYLTFSELLTTAYAGTREELPVVVTLLEGAYAPAFWGFIAFGLLAPIALIALPTRRRVAALALAAAFAVVGMWLKRLLITLPSSTLPLIDDAGPWGTAVFTWVPLLITAAATAGIALGLMLLFRFVPILAIDEIEEAAAAEAAARGEAAADDTPRPALAAPTPEGIA